MGLIVLQAGSESESDAVFDSEVQQRAGGFVISTTPFFNSHRERLPRWRQGIPFRPSILSATAFFEYPKGIAKVDRDAIGAMQHVSFACGPKRYHQILERLKANGVTINAGPLLVIPPAIDSFYFFDPNGIRLEITSDLDGDEEDLQVIRSCSMDETKLRAELETISSDRAWIDEMVAAMTS